MAPPYNIDDLLPYILAQKDLGYILYIALIVLQCRNAIIKISFISLLGIKIKIDSLLKKENIKGFKILIRNPRIILSIVFKRAMG